MTKAIRVKAPGGADQLDYTTIELAPCGADDIRVRQTVIGVNFIDIYQRMGLYQLPPDAIPGVEAVGEVIAAGANVSGIAVGDMIAYAGAPVGAYTSERNLPAWKAVRLPRNLLGQAVASIFLKGITAYMLLTRVYPVSADTTVLIHSAAGGLGRLTAQWARRLGATVIGTVGSEAKAATAHEAGVHHVIVGRDADFVRSVSDLTSGRGVDAAYDGIGGTTLAKTLGCVRPFGVVASIGQSAGPIAPIDVNDLGPRRSIVLARPSVMAYVNHRKDYHAAASAVLSALAAGHLHAAGTAYRLRDAARAHRDLETGQTSGSLYLEP